MGQIAALSCVFQGRKGATTDHDSILFNVNVGTGMIKGGTTNVHLCTCHIIPICSFGF